MGREFESSQARHLFYKMNYIAALYQFTEILEPHPIRQSIAEKLEELSVTGTILIGHEGINGTISAKQETKLLQAIEFLKQILDLENLDIKFSQSEVNPFIRLKIKLKKEIVTIGDPSINPNSQVGEYVNAKDWNALIADKDTLIIDTRNNYENSIGTFKNAINPKTTKFREFPQWLESQKFSKDDKNNKKIAMFCTGGIRCEKASSLMKSEGFEHVYHLHGGILKYLEETTEDESLWEGECFVFDDRVSVKHDLSEGSYDLCHGCRMPITDADKTSSHYVKGVSCPHCYSVKTERQKARYRSRQKQIDLAKQRHQRHLGPRTN